MELGASAEASDERGQKPIHAAAQNNHSEIVKLFLKSQPNLVMSSTKVRETKKYNNTIILTEIFKNLIKLLL